MVRCDALDVRILDQFVASKAQGTPPLDAIITTGRWAGVADQSTPKSADEPDLLRALGDAVADLDHANHLSARQVVDSLSRAVANAQVSEHGRPCLTFAFVDAAQRRVIRVGDCHITIDDRALPGTNAVDDVLGPMRALVVEMAVTGQGTASGTGDPGRDAIQPWLKQAATSLRNHPDSRFGFGAIDGGFVPDRYVEEFSIGPNKATVSVLTDGYLAPARERAEAEARLRDALLRDPLMIDAAQTKGRSPGADSFDDRAFLSVELPEPS